MIEKEAIEYLKSRYLVVGSPLNPPRKECEKHNAAIDMAIHALEKRVPDQPALEGDGYDTDGEIILDEWLCPGCGTRYEVDYDEYKFCPECGQAIDWGDEHDTEMD